MLLLAFPIFHVTVTLDILLGDLKFSNYSNKASESYGSPTAEESGVWISANDVRLETGQGYSGTPQHVEIYTDAFWGCMDIPAWRLLHL